MLLREAGGEVLEPLPCAVICTSATAFDPPTSLVLEVFTPGISSAMLKCVRPDGMVSMTSLLMTCCCRTPWTSTTGDSPVTVIVSSSAPTRSSAFTLAVNEPASSMPSRRDVLKPGSVKVTE